MFADVAVPLPLFRTFTYSVPLTAKSLRPGCRVVVPFRNSHLVGVAVRVHKDPPSRKVKPISKVLDEEPLFSDKLLKLGLWVTAYYLAPPGEALRIMLPPRLLSKKISKEESEIPEKLWPARKRLAVVSMTVREVQLTTKQSRIVQLLGERPLPVFAQPFMRETGCSRSVLDSLASKGLLRMETVEVYRSPWSGGGSSEVATKHSLNSDQLRILQKINGHLSAGVFHSMLVHGITGSGKTEVYLNAIEGVLAAKKTALMLVPEIGLTPQISRQFRAWFGDQVALLHSALSEGERFDQWRRISSGKARVVVGTRSAVFAPLLDVGIIIVDEEHDTSYKQEDLPRYNGRDVALKRGELEGALVVLGSATPQLETYYRATTRGHPEYETLSSRILERPLPTVQVVDMRVEFQQHGKVSTISKRLKEAIAERIEKGEQALVLLNRRGYASALLCRSCGNTEECHNCSISLTYHQRPHRLFCHYCGYQTPLPKRCRVCAKEYIHFLGQGTEKVQEALREAFPQAAVDRLDRDSVQRKGSFERILGNLAAARTDVLVGTQMIAKGHDFPGVTLVGVLEADQGLRMADFRAAERTFQLLTQVAGRAGRGEKAGEVVIQTYYPNHYSLKHACAQDYRLFFDEEIRFRRSFRYPPYTALANLVLQGPEPGAVRSLAVRVQGLLVEKRDALQAQQDMRILGPSPAALERLKGQFRVQLLIKTRNRKAMRDVLRSALEDLERKGVSLKKISIDIDPVSLL